MSQATESYHLIRPLSAGNIVTISLFIYRSYFKLYYGIAFRANLWIIVPIFGIFLFWIIISKPGADRNYPFWILLLVITGMISSIYGYAKFLTASALISRLVFNELMGQSESLKDVRKQVNSKIRSFLGTAILVDLILLAYTIALLIAISIVWFIILLVIGLIQAYVVDINKIRNQSILIIIGLILLLLMIGTVISFIAGLTWIYSRFLVAELPLAIESNLKSGNTIGRSWGLTKKSAARIQGVITITYLITLPIQVPIQILSLVLQKPNSFLYQALYMLILVGLGLLGSALIVPFWQAVKAVTYYDLRIRQEGLGMQQRLRRRTEEEGIAI